MDRSEWMAEVCRHAALTMEAHGLGNRTEQLRNVADQLAALTSPQADKARGEVVLDPQLATFYQVTTVAGLLAAQEEHIQKLQYTVRRNVKPWEDTFPPTLLPKYMRDSGLLDGEGKAALAAELQRIDNISAAIGGTPEIAQMYRDACVEFVRHPVLLAMLASQENKA